MVCWVSYALIIIGALNWGLYGVYNQFDLVAYALGGYNQYSQIVYALVGLSGIIHPMIHSSK